MTYSNSQHCNSKMTGNDATIWKIFESTWICEINKDIKYSADRYKKGLMPFTISIET